MLCNQGILSMSCYFHLPFIFNIEYTKRMQFNFPIINFV